MYAYGRIRTGNALLARLDSAFQTMRTASGGPLVKLAALIAVSGVIAFSAYVRFHPQSAGTCLTDFYSDYQAALALRHGTSPYTGLASWITAHSAQGGSGPFTSNSCVTGILEFAYTPFFALLLIPFTWLPFTAALALWNASELLLLAGSVYAFLRAARMSPSIVHVLLLTAVALLTSPLRFELYYAQADVFTLFFICAALWARTSERTTLAGVLLAVACATEPALLLALPLLVWKRELRFAAVAAVTSAAWILLPYVVLGAGALRDYLVVAGFYANEHAVVLTNDAPKGVLLRLFTSNAYATPLAHAPWIVTPLWLLICGAALAVAGFLIAPRRLGSDSRSLLDVGLAVATSLLVSPWSENNQFTLLLVTFLAAYVCLWRARWSSPQTRSFGVAFACALVLFLVLGDPVQFALAGRLTDETILRPAYIILAAVYLVPLLAIAAAVIYGQRLFGCDAAMVQSTAAMQPAPNRWTVGVSAPVGERPVFRRGPTVRGRRRQGDAEAAVHESRGSTRFRE